MDRRTFLKTAAVLTGAACCAGSSFAGILINPSLTDIYGYKDDFIKDYLYKMQNFNHKHKDDIYLDENGMTILKAAVDRLSRLERTVGHGNFYLLNFDDAVNIAQNYTSVGRFTKEELDFMEELFYEDGSKYGFWGDKPIKNITEKIDSSKTVKIHGSGNYVYKGLPLEVYSKIKKELGDEVILTSGIRNVIKQFMLFLKKAYKSNGNLSMASRSLAPPGYSFHGRGDFDVGQVGFGIDNFTEKFTETDVFKKLIDSGYIRLRYEKNNLFGVRFEPWHIKI